MPLKTHNVIIVLNCLPMTFFCLLVPWLLISGLSKPTYCFDGKTPLLFYHHQMQEDMCDINSTYCCDILMFEPKNK